MDASLTFDVALRRTGLTSQVFDATPHAAAREECRARKKTARSAGRSVIHLLVLGVVLAQWDVEACIAHLRSRMRSW